MRRLIDRAGMLIVVVLCTAGAHADEPAAARPADEAAQRLGESLTGEIQPLLAAYCVKCHGGDEPKADLALDAFPDLSSVFARRANWESVLEMVSSQLMPPEDQKQPTAEERARLIGWIEDALASGVDCGGSPDPGRVTIRRLNRAEYNNTIRDLLGVDFRPADDFPTDDVGYGFDNIGDVLSLPPLLLEKYMLAAEEIAARAIVTPESLDPPVNRFRLGRLHTTGAAVARRGEGIVFASSGSATAQMQFPRDGEYIIRLRAYADQAGDEVARAALLLDDEDLQTIDVAAVSGDATDYELRVQVAKGEHAVSVAFVNDYYNPEAEDSDQRDRNLYVRGFEVVGPVDLDQASLPESHRRILFVEPSDADAAPAAARQIMARFAERAFRRPAAEREVDRLAGFVDLVREHGGSFERGVQLAVQAALVSPHFLFRVELDHESDSDDGVHAVNDFELASRLSYFLWSSMPDEALFQRARQGELRDREVLETEVRRMLADPKSSALVENFADQWLQIRTLKDMTPDPALFPTFDEPLRQAMRRETELFFETVVREDRSILEFLDADFTFLNERLARHYGLSGVSGDEFQRVSLDGSVRGGVLTQASVLTVTSNPTRTSPVKRGKWILEQIVGSPTPPPPPDVPELDEDEGAELTGSLRQRMEQHRENPSCASCHQRMDPLGFGFENFDAVGAWRERDGTFPIDPSGVLPDGRSFNGPGDLKQLLKNDAPEFARSLAEKLLTYALGRGLESYDACAVDAVADAVIEQDYRFSALVMGIVSSDPFLLRRDKQKEGEK